MKKRSLLLLPLLASPMFLSSCWLNIQKATLTYGTYCTQTLDTLVELSTNELYNRLYNENEVLILATYNDSYSEDCLCWTTFQNVIVNYINKYHEQIFIYNTKNADETIKDLRISFYEDSEPGLHIYNGKKEMARFYYPKMQDKKMFEDLTGEYTHKKIHEYINEPSIYAVNKQALDDKITAQESDFAVLFMRSGCGDCKYVIPNVIIPYINKNKLSKNILFFDLQLYYDLSKESEVEEEQRQYQALKDYYGLSEITNEKYGYGQGVVPTIQFYAKGVLKDATVYFNDSISQKEDGSFYVSKSYYSESRLPNLAYLKNSQATTVLEGMSISAENALQTKSGGYYWSQSDAAKYHTPLLKAFLDYYLL